MGDHGQVGSVRLLAVLLPIPALFGAFVGWLATGFTATLGAPTAPSVTRLAVLPLVVSPVAVVVAWLLLAVLRRHRVWVLVAGFVVVIADLLVFLIGLGLR